jgi:hypothetical protein
MTVVSFCSMNFWKLSGPSGFQVDSLDLVEHPVNGIFVPRVGTSEPLLRQPPYLDERNRTVFVN